MEKDIEKKTQILSQLDHTSLNYEIFKACEGRKLTDIQLKELGYDLFILQNGKRAGSLPAFGCSVSHYSIYKKMSSEKIEYALILEDDSILSEKLEDSIKQISSLIADTEDPTVILLTPEFRYHNKSKIIQINEFSICCVTGGYMTTGYLINLAGARLLAERLYPIRYVADAWSDFIKMGLKVYGITPHLVSYSGLLGEIGLSIRPDDEPLMLKLRHYAGRFKALITNAIAYLRGYRKSKRTW